MKQANCWIDSFQDEQDEPAPLPNIAPAPGSALLDVEETDNFHQFFDKFDVASLDTNGYLSSNMDIPGSQWDDWNQNSLPIFEGSTTSLLPPNLHSSMFALGATNQVYDFGSDRPQQSRLSIAVSTPPAISSPVPTLDHGRKGFQNHRLDFQPQILDASVNLFDSTQQASLHQHEKVYNGREAFNNPDSNGSGAMMPRNLATTFHSDSSNSMDRTFLDAYPQLRNIFFDTSNTLENPDFKKLNEAGAYPQFGSDSNFHHLRYDPPPDQKNPEEVTKELIRVVDCLEPQTSAGNTQPPSPMQQKHKRRLSDGSTSTHVSAAMTNGVGHTVEDDKIKKSQESRGKRRRKGRMQSDTEIGFDEENEDDVLTLLAKSRRRPGHSPQSNKRDSKPHISPDLPQAKGRRSQRAEVKAPRQNLTDNQKRNNHILSEQKRRDLIKQGFEQLFQLVPATKAAGTSRSQQLSVAADWLERLIQGNERLRRQLSSLHGRET